MTEKRKKPKREYVVVQILRANLRRECSERGLREIARDMDVSAAALCRIKNGAGPSVRIFLKLCTRYGATISFRSTKRKD